ncbi:MAG: methylisocitrate lyase [Phycisphaerales bacterium]|nr:methylisocitrate lyase [Phycisphaerales bacterium]
MAEQKAISRNARLRSLIADQTVAMPGAMNALSARAIERAGFEAMYLSGAVMANSVVGLPDTGVTTLSEAAAHAARCAAVTTIPIIADADTGYGSGPGNAARTIQEYERAGLSGLHLEDQEFPKRCGHLDGKRLVPIEEFCEYIGHAAAARRDPDFMIIARTDARGVTGYDDAVARAKAYLKAGADAIFPEALADRDEFARFARDVRAPLLANMTEFGKTPYLSVDEFAELGYKMVIFPVTLQRVAMKAIESALAELRRHGTQQGILDRMQTRQELYDLLGYDAR